MTSPSLKFPGLTIGAAVARAKKFALKKAATDRNPPANGWSVS